MASSFRFFRRRLAWEASHHSCSSHSAPAAAWWSVCTGFFFLEDFSCSAGRRRVDDCTFCRKCRDQFLKTILFRGRRLVCLASSLPTFRFARRRLRFLGVLASPELHGGVNDRDDQKQSCVPCSVLRSCNYKRRHRFDFLFWVLWCGGGGGPGGEGGGGLRCLAFSTSSTWRANKVVWVVVRVFC